MKWRYKTAYYIQYSSPSVSDLALYIGSWDANLYCLNTDDGTLKWRYKAGGAIDSSPFIYKGYAYFGCLDSFIYALNIETGNSLWRSRTGDFINSSPFVIDDVVYIGSDDDWLHAVDIKDGSMRWRYNSYGDISSSPYAKDGVVYVGGEDSYIYAIETFGYQGFNEKKTSSCLPFPSLSAYPNPFSTRLFVILPSLGAIYSLTGKLIINLDKGKHSINTVKWKDGLYVLKSGGETKMIVKIR